MVYRADRTLDGTVWYMRSKRGFSIVEVTVVFVILGILSLIGWTLMRSTTSGAINAGTVPALKTIASAVDDRHASRGVWVSDPETLGSLVKGARFTTGTSTAPGLVSSTALNDGVALATISASGDCLSLTVTSTGWTDGSYVPSDSRPCRATEVNQ